MPARRILGPIVLLQQAGRWVTRAIQRRFAGAQALSVREQ